MLHDQFFHHVDEMEVVILQLVYQSMAPTLQAKALLSPPERSAAALREFLPVLVLPVPILRINDLKSPGIHDRFGFPHLRQ